MPGPLHRLFAAHPLSVGESYGEHFLVAWRFGVALLSGGLACLVHALVPALCERTGSTTIKRLYGEMVSRQPGAPRPAHEEPHWRPEYEI